MTFRVDRSTEEGVAVLRISGRIAAEDLEILRATVEAERGALVIDLENVGLVDGAAIRFLAATEANGGALRNGPAYIREWIERERKSTEQE